MANRKSVLKTVFALSAAAGASLYAPAAAFADNPYGKVGGDAHDQLSGNGDDDAVDFLENNDFVDNGLTDSLWTSVSNLVTWAMGVALAIFVLRIALTAIHRMLLQPTQEENKSGQGGKDSDKVPDLTSIPLIGAYNDDVPWSRIWISFGIKVAVIVFVWILIGVIASFVNGAVQDASNQV